MLSGRVRFMFQPAEETFEGAKDMMEDGILDTGGCRRGTHGAYPHNSIDPINIGVHIYLALESLIAREADPGKACVLTIGSFSVGSAEIEMISEVPPLVCDPAMTDQMAGYMKELPIPGLTPVSGISASASEDFAAIAEKVPSVFMYLSRNNTRTV